MQQKKNLALSIDSEAQTALVCRALSSPARLRILQEIVDRQSSITDLAEKLSIPQSTMTMHIRALEQAGLISVTPLPGSRGSQKLCGAILSNISIDIMIKPKDAPIPALIFEQDMPIGNYFDYEITAPCGIASYDGPIASDDDPDGFVSADRFGAQIIWLTLGRLEYRFSSKPFRNSLLHVDRIEFTLELCSETFCYNEQWKSDVTVEINGQEIGYIECPGDHGGRKGQLNPDWWPSYATQFGDLHRIVLASNHCSIDNQILSDFSLGSLVAGPADYIRFAIAVKPDARYAGGFNLFGKQFGDYAQNIVMRVYGKA